MAPRRRTFADVAEASSRVANLLRDAGVQPGDYVVMMLGRQLAWWEVFTASLRMGAVISPEYHQLSAQDIAYRVNASKATCVVTDTANAAKVDRVVDQCPSLRVRVLVDGRREWLDYREGGDKAKPVIRHRRQRGLGPGHVLFTSGTTGCPKMCLHRTVTAWRTDHRQVLVGSHPG